MAKLELNEGVSTLDDTSDELFRYPDESLILKLEIGASVQDLVINENEDPEEAVRKFCTHHKLSSEVAKVLLSKVVENIPAERLSKTKPRFIKKGNFIKKEIRGQSAIRLNSSRLSPCRQTEEEKYHDSPIVRDKFRMNSGTRLLAKPRQQSTRIITQFVPSTSQFSRSMAHKNPLAKSQASQKPAKRLFSDEQSQTILNRIRFLKIKKLFEAIDAEKSGFITEESFSRFRNNEVKQILRPVLSEIIAKGKMHLGEFENQVDLLLTRITNNERMLLLDVKIRV